MQTSKFKYRNEIDGLRALAILPVVVFHLGARWLPGGFVGVDVFFVISGYLITSLILKEHQENSFSLRNFWLRRVRRIMPAMLFMLLLSLVAARFVLFKTAWRSMGLQSVATLLLCANVVIWYMTHGYWGPTADHLPLLHNWSLSVEEQFYLFYPFLIVAIVRWLPRKLVAILFAILFLGLIASVVGTRLFPSAAFFMLPTRAWELAGGCLLAGIAYKTRSNRQGEAPPWIEGKPRVIVSSGLAAMGIILIALSWFVIDGRNFPGYVALLPVTGAMLVIQFAGGPGCPATMMLASSPLRFIGRISYSLYLWHWPVIVLDRAARVRWGNFPSWIGLALIPALALISYYLVETPNRKRLRIVPPVLAGAALVGAVSAYLILARPVYDLSPYAPTVWAGESYSASPNAMAIPDWFAVRRLGVTVSQRDPRYADAYLKDGIIKRYHGDTWDVLVLGNSHALMWAATIDQICSESKLTVCFYAADAVPPIPDMPARREAQINFSPEQWYRFDSRRTALIERYHPQLVVISSRWSADLKMGKALAFLEFVRRAGGQVLFVDDPPELEIGDISAPYFAATTSAQTVKAHDAAAQDFARKQLHSLAERFSFVHVVEVADLYMLDGKARIKDGGSILYTDEDHLSVAGADLAKQRIESAILGIVAKPVAAR